MVGVGFLGSLISSLQCNPIFIWLQSHFLLPPRACFYRSLWVAPQRQDELEPFSEFHKIICSMGSGIFHLWSRAHLGLNPGLIVCLFCKLGNFPCVPPLTHQKTGIQDFPGSPVVKTQRFHCKGYRLDPWLGKWNTTCHSVRPKTKQNKRKNWDTIYNPSTEPFWGNCYNAQCLAHSRINDISCSFSNI